MNPSGFSSADNNVSVLKRDISRAKRLSNWAWAVSSAQLEWISVIRTFKSRTFSVDANWFVNWWNISKRIVWVVNAISTVMDAFRALINIDADVTTAAGLDDTVSVAESVAGAALVETVISVVILAVAFVIPESTWLGHAVGTSVAGMLAWLADTVWIVDTEKTSISIDTTLSSSTSMSHL